MTVCHLPWDPIWQRAIRLLAATTMLKKAARPIFAFLCRLAAPEGVAGAEKRRPSRM